VNCVSMGFGGFGGFSNAASNKPCWLLLLGLIAWSGCDVVAPDNTFACKADAECPTGQVCAGAELGVTGRCSRSAKQASGAESSGTSAEPMSGSGPAAGSAGVVGASGEGGGPASGASGTAGRMAAGAGGTRAVSGGAGAAAGAGGTGMCATAQPSETSDGCCPPGANATTDADCQPACGDGVVDMGETCDPASSCPTAASCKSTNPCLAPMLAGDPTLCTAKCALTPITICKSGDACCANGCNYGSDTDCSASCGDGVVGVAETCEPTSTTQPCPTSCDDGIACTTDVQTGTASQCNVACTHTPITAPTTGDACCPQGANANNDGDCKPTCGNGVIESGERCDGNCPTSCDDGIACTSDTLVGTAAACTAECSHVATTACKGGDGCCAPGCNNGNDSDCAARCGDGHVDAGETCDGNCPSGAADCNDNMPCTTDFVSGSACSRQCGHVPITSLSSVQDGCCPSGGNATNDADCAARCGNGAVESPEKCDDGNMTSNDGCSATCMRDDNLATPGDDRPQYVTCGPQSCESPGGTCCLYTAPPMCIAGTSTCQGSISACDGPEDCDAAHPICWGFVSGSGSACEANTQTLGGQMCHTSSDCQPEMGMLLVCNSNGFCSTSS
jgi:cysteine-rich repeat protein